MDVELLSPNLFNFVSDCRMYNFNSEHNFVAQDNGKFVIIKREEDEYFAYTDNKLIKLKKELKIIIEFDGNFFWKSIISFNQNNKLIADSIRRTTKEYLTKSFYYNSYKTSRTSSNDISRYSQANKLIGIGGEYYIYFASLKYDGYIGYMNYLSRYNDAIMNCKMYGIKAENYFVDFNNFSIDNKELSNDSSNQLSNELLNDSYDVVINVLSLSDGMIEEIRKLNINKLVIIMCKPIYKKVKKLSKYFRFREIDYFDNMNSYINISLWTKRC